MSNRVAEAKESWRHSGDQIISSLIMSQKPLEIGKLAVCYGSADKMIMKTTYQSILRLCFQVQLDEPKA